MSKEISIDDFYPGCFARYKMKNELAVVKRRASESHVFIWGNLGGTAARCHIDLLEPLDIEQIRDTEFTNAYAVPSLVERAIRLGENGDTSDLIEDGDIEYLGDEPVGNWTTGDVKEEPQDGSQNREF